MVESIRVRNRSETPFVQFLETNDYEVEQVTENVLRLFRFDEDPVFVDFSGDTLYFEVDLGGIGEIGSKALYLRLLDLNTQILPVSVGIDTTNIEDPRLVLIESREAQNLDENELLSVLNALEIATDRVAQALSEFVS